MVNQETPAEIRPYPTEEETRALKQSPGHVDGIDYIGTPAIMPYLCEKLKFKPWKSFDVYAQNTAAITQEILDRDDGILQMATEKLFQLWKRVDAAPLFDIIDIDLLLSTVFDLVLYLLKCIEPRFPLLTCTPLVLIPRCLPKQPQVLQAFSILKKLDDKHSTSPYVCIAPYEAGGCMYEMKDSIEIPAARSAADMSRRWNELFGEKIGTQQQSFTRLRLAIVEAVTQGLYTKTGIAAIYSYRSVAVMRIHAIENEKGDERLQVGVSPLYNLSDSVNTLHALVTAVKIAVEGVDADGRRIENLLGSVLSKGHTGLMKMTDAVPIAMLQDQGAGHARSLNEKEESVWISERALSLYRKETGKQGCGSTNPYEFFDYLLSSYCRILYAYSGSSVLLLGSLCGVPVVTKYSNFKVDEGFEEIQNEISMYDIILKENRHLVGDVVPDILGIRKFPENNPVLVMEFVGHPVEKLNDAICVGGKPVSSEDWEKIIVAGNNGLKRLKDIGLYHGDPQAGNIRAERVKDSPRNEKWKVWWIDFGLGSTAEKKGEKWYEVLEDSCENPVIYFDRIPSLP